MLTQALIEWALRSRQKKLCAAIGEDIDVKAYLEKIVAYFDAGKAKDRRMTLVYEIHDSGANDGVWTVSIADGKCTLTEGEAASYDTKMYMTAEVYRRILTGQLELGHLAYATGAVRYYGNSLGQRELNSYLTIPKKVLIAKL